MSYLVDPLSLAMHQGLTFRFGDPETVFTRQRRVRVCFHEIEALAQAFSLYVTEIDGAFGVMAIREVPLDEQASLPPPLWPVLTRLHPFGIIQDLGGGFKLSLARDRINVLEAGGEAIFERDQLARPAGVVYRAARRFLASQALLARVLDDLRTFGLLERAQPEAETRHAFGRPLFVARREGLQEAISSLLVDLEPKRLSVTLAAYLGLALAVQNREKVTTETEREIRRLADEAAELSVVLPEGGLGDHDSHGASFLVEDDAILTYGGYGSSRFFEAG